MHIRNTYKELKLVAISELNIISFLILEIPIRNWNDLGLNKLPIVPLILEIPIRNWNSPGTIISASVKHYIRNTYKELKPEKNKFQDWGERVY